VRVLLDTSVLIGAESPGVLEGASAASLAELHLGVLAAAAEEERARRAQRLGVIEATFDPLPSMRRSHASGGRLAAAVAMRGGKPRRASPRPRHRGYCHRHKVPLLTHDPDDFGLIADLVEARAPA
jgi:predicted nucleic acid-binding protein